MQHHHINYSIKVENAKLKANDGKNIADKMIKGYTGLNDNISKTIDLIASVESASKEQQLGMVQINDAVNSLDKQTQENANIASQTNEVATQTDTLAKLVVSSANEKEFRGKNTVKAKNSISSKSHLETNHNRKENKGAQVVKTSTLEKKNITPIEPNIENDEWASF